MNKQKKMKIIVIVITIALLLFLLWIAFSGQKYHNSNIPLCPPRGAFPQIFEGQGSIEPKLTFNPYANTHTPWRSSGIPHAPITFRPDNQDKQDYGSQNAIIWDLEKTAEYFPYRSYKNYGMYGEMPSFQSC